MECPKCGHKAATKFQSFVEPIYNLIISKYDFGKPAETWMIASQIARMIGIKNITQMETRAIVISMNKIYAGYPQYFQRKDRGRMIKMPPFL